VLDGLAAYERRHEWKGHLLNVIAGGLTLDQFKHPDWASPPDPGSYQHALVTNVLPYQLTARIGEQPVILTADDWAWTAQKTADEFLKVGDIVYVHLADALPHGSAWRATLEQDSGVEGSLFAMDNASGDVLAMVGGRDFNLSQFNRAVQSERQTGSSFKPYVYTAAVEEGARPDDIITDAPTTFATSGGPYTPHNYEGNYLGPITLLHALADSRNIPTLKLAERIGIRRVIETAHRFGITSNIPAYLPVALGSVEVTLEEQVAAYSAFPNDGIRIAPRLVRKVTNADGVTLQDAPPQVSEATSSKTARIMLQFLQQVIRGGTGSAAAALNHPLGGKTGTTSDFTDAWFIGFSPSTSCGVWVGYDSRQTLGEKENGAKAALPIWMDFMKAAIAGKENESFPGVPTSRSAGTSTQVMIAAPAAPIAVNPVPANPALNGTPARTPSPAASHAP
jgi:penicillin-binding protein 1A